MAETPEKTAERERYSKQAEALLDAHIRRFEREDEEQSFVLKKLRSTILKEVENEEISKDLSLSKEEFYSILEKLFKSDELKDFLEQKKITSFSGFLDYFDLRMAFKPENFKLYGEPVNFVHYHMAHMLSDKLSPKQKENFQKCFAQIERRTDLKPFIDKSTAFYSFGETRIEFTIEKDQDGKKVAVKYMAYPDGVFRVLKDDPEGINQQLAEKEKEIRELQKKIIRKLKNDTSLTEEEKFNIAHFPDEQCPKDYQELKSSLERLYKEMTEIYNKGFTRELYDDENSLRIEEYCRGRDMSESTNQKFFNTNGQLVKIEKWFNGVNFYTEGYNPRVAERKVFNKSFSLDKTNGSIVRYNEKGELTSKIVIKDKKILVMESPTYVVNYDEKGRRTSVIGKNGLGYLTKMYIYDGEKVQVIRTYAFEKRRRPQITPHQYLTMLAARLDTPAKLGQYMEIFVKYARDDLLEELKSPLRYLSAPFTDHWQSAERTLQRSKFGILQGDCEDYSFFVQEILKRQGKNAKVVAVWGLADPHVTCIWTEKNADGTYTAYSLSSEGLDKKGKNQKEETKLVNTKNLKAEGYKTVKEAVNAVLLKYYQSDFEENAPEFEPKDSVVVIGIGRDNFKYFQTEKIEEAFK